MSPPWMKLWDIIEGEQYFRTELSRFFRYCSKQGIAPSEINDQVLADYLNALEAETFVKDAQGASAIYMPALEQMCGSISGAKAGHRSK